MRSPEFRKHTGFIKRRNTQDSQDASEEELSSYRLYDRPINHPERYVYPSLAREYSLGNTNTNGKLSPSDDKSSSEFDQFEMNSSLSSEFPMATANLQKNRPTQSSFSLSPYQNSSGSEEQQQQRRPAIVERKVPSYNYQRGPIREETSEDNPSVEEDSYRRSKNMGSFGRKTGENTSNKHHLLRHEESSKYKKKQQSQSSSEESSGNFETINNRLSEKSRPSDAFQRHRFAEKSNRKEKLKERSAQKSQESSSSFSLDSFDESPPKSKPIAEKKRAPLPPPPPAQRLPSQDRLLKNPSSRTHLLNNDKTATFSRPEQFKQKSTAAEKRAPQYQPEPEIKSESSEELITEYDTKEFKGGSIKEQIMNSYYNKQREGTQQRYNSKTHLTHQSSRSPPHIVKPAVSPVQNIRPSKINHQKEESSEFNSEEQSFSAKKKPRAEAFELDVKAKLTLAEAFEVRCGRLKQRLEQEREQFKHGHLARLYKQKWQQEQQLLQENDQNRENLETKQPERPVNRNVERLALGIKPAVTRKEMFKLTKKKYKQLPEVRHRQNEEKKRQDFARRMQNVKKLDREVRLRLKYSNRP